jgi:hypothetical protein
VSGARIIYTARPDATPESERETLASIYAFVLRTHQERQKAASSSRPEDAERRPDGSGAAPVARG